MRTLALIALLAPGLVFAATPSEGVALQVRRGFFTETDVGVFFTLGGQEGYSNAQTYLQLGLGYDVSENIELGFHFGIGSNAQNCFAVQDPNDPLADSCAIRTGAGTGTGTAATTSFPDNFTLTFLDVTAAYLFKVRERFYIAPKLAGGYTFLDPAPLQGSDGTLISSGPNVGAGVGIEYATHMDHFSIGADVLGRFIVGPNIFTLAIFPRVKYTF